MHSFSSAFAFQCTLVCKQSLNWVWNCLAFFLAIRRWEKIDRFKFTVCYLLSMKSTCWLCFRFNDSSVCCHYFELPRKCYLHFLCYSSELQPRPLLWLLSLFCDLLLNIFAFIRIHHGSMCLRIKCYTIHISVFNSFKRNEPFYCLVANAGVDQR